MRKEWSFEELVDSWTLVTDVAGDRDDWKLLGKLGNKTGVTRLRFALLLKFYELEGRFPAFRRKYRRRLLSTLPGS